MGVTGAVTLGSEAINDVNKVFGQERARQIFLGKEIIIILDSDETGITNANKLAKSLYPYAKQIKIINLDKSEINPNGLDSNLTKEISEGENKKIKRIEKDFTDFIKKNGFGNSAIEMFSELIENTIVYTQNENRIKKERFKVTLQECRYPRYFSSDGSKILELIASVGEFNNKAFMCCKNFEVSCAGMNAAVLPRMCNNCMLSKMPGFVGAKSLNFHFVRDIPKDQETNPFYVRITEHDSLGLIEVLNNQKEQQQKVLCGINRRCEQVVLADGIPEKLLHVKLKKDINEYVSTENITNTGGADIDVEAYMVGEKDIYPNKTYKFEATQTTAWNGQHAVLFIHKAEPIETCIDTFKMDQQTYELLQIFKSKDNESIEEHIERRYSVFANAAGVTGRREMFFLNDLSFFSATEINNKKLLPGIKRGWVEVLIGGDTRTCKSMITKFLHNHYKIGDMITGSTAVTRPGLLGGAAKMNNKYVISWGKIPMNDGGLIIIDELSNIKEDVFSDMTGCRSDGVVSIDTIVSGKALARTRKIMLSNQRAWKEEIKTDGIYFVKKLCFKDEILARFDLAWVARRSDVDVETFKADYSQIGNAFNEYQCQSLIRFVYSRKADDFIFEDGFEELINRYQIELTNKFHPSTQLVNQEMRAKLVRLSISLASMLFSTPDDDWNKILVKKEHLEYIAKFIKYLYCHPNMALDIYSNKIRQNEILGNMEFMENIAEYVDLNQIDQTSEFTDKYIQQMFFDYLYKVQIGKLAIPDATNDSSTDTLVRVFEGVSKLIGILTSRHCLERTNKGTYKKTQAFAEWIAHRLEMGNAAPRSSILELGKGDERSKISEASAKFVKFA
jgi:5S rRNA maturation endonuclease (ribonuclease M5)